MQRLTSFTDLVFSNCKELDISKDERGNILDFHGGFQSLRSVKITFLPKLTSLQQWLLQAHNLEHLYIAGCDNLKDIPEQIEALQSLQNLNIEGCSLLTSFPEAMRRLTSLTHLALKNCNELDISKDESDNILNFHGGLQSLRSMVIEGLPKLTSLSQWLLQARNLKHLDISLESLTIVRCHQLTSLSQCIRHLSSLVDLSIQECEELDISKDKSGNILDFHGGLQSLRSVDFTLLPKLTSLPQWLLQARNLERLEIWGCHNLKDIPEQIETLQSLQILVVEECDSLTSFPEAMRRLTSLTHLTIYRCPKLEESCERQAGKDWDKIAHIPNIRFR
ncbi:hypothetical protein ACJRO7_010385 [Eucalyptus globulus]|uniref:Disease resistance protein At4g27190-like leucine-rich repeats domain-containing protein n=1 Tax=Eucalyptus globulus TaxID=34317 RepID=A0ABD3LHG4_EUCGL